MPLRTVVAMSIAALCVSGCGGAGESAASMPTLTSGAVAEGSRTPDAGSGPAGPTLFACPLDGRGFGQATPAPHPDRQQETARRVEATGWDGFVVERAAVTHLGVVVLITGDLDLARNVLTDAGVAHVYEWDPSVAAVGVDAAGQVEQVLRWLIEPAVRELRADYRGVPGYESLALRQAAGAVVLQWKAPVPDSIMALAGLRRDGVRVIVEPTRFSARDLHIAATKVTAALRGGRVDADWSTTRRCGDGSGLVVGIEPVSLGDRRAALQAQLRETAGLPVYVVPERAPVAL